MAEKKDTAVDKPESVEHVVKINRVAKVAKGGRRFGFSVLVVAGDGDGHVGYGLGKAKEVAEAIKKGASLAKKNFAAVRRRNTTVQYQVTGEFGSAKVLLKPAAAGTGVIAGGAVRAVMESAGISDVVTKSLGSSSPLNIVRATMNGLTEMKKIEERALMRSRK